MTGTPDDLGRPRRPTILLVEDSALVAMTLQDVLEDLGYQTIGPASTLTVACEMARVEEFDAAILDVNLDGHMSWDVALLLRERNRPFVFSTGYAGSAMPAAFADAPVMVKPFTITDVRRTLQQLLGTAAAPSLRGT